MKQTITDLQHLKIYTQSGIYLGRVFDLRSSGLPEHGETHTERVIDRLVYGKLGLLERLGLKQSQADTVSWSSVSKIEAGKIIVGAEVRPTK